MAKKITLVFTEIQLDSLLSLIYTIEATHGCSDSDYGEENDYDTNTKKEIRNLDRMFKMNGYKRQ